LTIAESKVAFFGKKQQIFLTLGQVAQLQPIEQAFAWLLYPPTPKEGQQTTVKGSDVL
jgi:hypothetical protein